MPKKIDSFAMSEEVVNEIDQTSKALGMSRSEYVETMLKKGFHFTSDEKEAVQEITTLQGQIMKKIRGKEVLYDQRVFSDT
jgi:metal-responsive CopG/Arc/MetJ family transcriptional regulator